MENKTLVAYFSASGVTAETAKQVANAAGAALFEIVPQTPYTPADLDWRNKQSRSTLEMQNDASRPAVQSRVADMAAYTTVLVGFPVWWYKAPTIINTFLEMYSFAGKTIIPFATSGGSGLGDTVAHLQGSAPGAHWAQGRVLNGLSAGDIAAWVKTLNL